MNKRLIDRFTDEFEKHLSNERTRAETFEKAREEFEKVCGFTPYSNLNSFRAAKRQDRKKRKR